MLNDLILIIFYKKKLTLTVNIKNRLNVTKVLKVF